MKALHVLVPSLAFSLLSCERSGSRVQEETPFASYEACVSAKLPAFADDDGARRITEKVRKCTLEEQRPFYKTIAQAHLQQRNETCNSLSQWSESCLDVLSDCRQNEPECKTALGAIYECTRYSAQSAQDLIAAGVGTAQNLADAGSALLGIARSCSVDTELDEEEPAQIWSMLCNDFEAATISFETLNQTYYDRMTDTSRSFLLDGFARSGSVSGWQSTVASIIALDALASSAPEVRAAGARVLEQHGDHSTPVLYGLVQALQDPDARVRAAAARALRTQGNRKALVLFLLLQTAWDTDPRVRANGALALREQLPQATCNPTAEARFSLPGDIPPCRPFVEDQHPNPADPDPNSQRRLDAEFPPEAGCGETISTESTSLNSVRDVASLRSFPVRSHICSLHARVPEERLLSLVQIVVLDTLQRESDPPARRTLVASLRTIAKGNFALESRLKQALNERDFRVRQAALFAASQAVSDKEWLFRALNDHLSGEPSASVREAAISAAMENAPLTLTLDAKDSAFDMYAAGVAAHRAVAHDCESSQGFRADRILQRNLFYQNGAMAAAFFFQDFACPQQAQGPALLHSSPGLAEQGVWPTRIELTFQDRVPREDFESRFHLVFNNANQAIALDRYEVLSGQTPESTTTRAIFKLETSLLPDNFYSMTFDEGFGKSDTRPGYRQKRQILFKTTSTGLADRVSDLMFHDPSESVQYRAAESFVQNNETEVIAFLLAKLSSRAPDSVYRAATTLASPLLTLQPIRQATIDERREFISRIVSSVIGFLKKNSAILEPEPPLESYRALPALMATQQLMKWTLDQGLVNPSVLKEVTDEQRLRATLLDVLEKDYPLRTYTNYERIGYRPIREEWVALFDAYLLKKPEEPSFFHILYESALRRDENHDD